MKVQNKNKVKELLGRLNSLENSSLPVDESKNLTTEIMNRKYAEAVDKVKSDSTVQMLDAIHTKLGTFQKDFDLKPVSSAIADFQTQLEEMKGSVAEENKNISSNIDSKLQALQQALASSKEEDKNTDSQDKQLLGDKISFLEAEIELLSQKKVEIPDFGGQIKETEKKLAKVILALKSEVEGNDKSQGLQAQITDLQKSIDKLRTDLMARISETGGGSMNRKITFGGTDFLTKYTDINYIAGTNVTFTVANNNTTKMVNVTISATGGGGGSVRSINNISTSQTAGSAAGTDYVYLCTGTLTLTLPDASLGNTNLYTVKNVGTGVVTINTTSAQTIDNDTTVIMPVRYTAVDLISDTANWNVT